MITFEPTEEQRMMRDTVADFAREKLRERVREFEAKRAIPGEVRRALAELGLTTLAIPEAYGGPGTDARTTVLVEEELAWADAGVAFAMPGPGAFARAVAALGDDAQARSALEPFLSDPLRVGAVAFSEARPHPTRPGFVTRVRRDAEGWVLDGTKSYVIGAGLASTYVVFAQVDEAKGWDGIGAFLVDGAAEGLEVSPRKTTLGLDAASIGDLVLRGVRVREEHALSGRGDFGRALRRFFAAQSLVVAARAVGVARAAWELARAFADERKAFGKPIGHFQSIAFLLADRHIDVEGARGLVWRAAWTLDTKPDDDAEVLARAAEAVAEAVEVAQQCASDAVQIHGGAGFVRDYLVEKLMRDAKQIALCAPTATTSDQLFAALALGAPLDPALVLPVPEVQPIFT